MAMRLGVALGVVVWLAAGLAGPTAAAPSWPQATAGVAPDPAVRFGVLANGLRYAVMHNETPKGQVVMRLQIEAGSMHEGPGQEGLAHFIEHMAFRGTTHAPDGEMIPSLERLGLQFGADSNASTSQVVTNYMFNLPRNDEASVERGLFLLREIASEIAFDPAIAKTESGVVLSEERSRAGENLEAAKAQLALIYGDHPYARPPIGNTEVVARADVKAMRAFYDAWYRPENAVLVVVGDIDVAAVEARIQGGFSTWVAKGPAGKTPAPLAPSSRPAQFEAIDGNPTVSGMTMTWVKPYALPTDSEADRLDGLARVIVLGTFSARMAAAAEGPNKPFLRASLTENIVLGTSRTVNLEAQSINDWRGGIGQLMKAKNQLATYGLTQNEIDVALTRIRAASQAAVAGASTRPSAVLANGLLGSAAGGRVFRTPADAAADFERLAPQVTLARVNALAAEFFDGEGPKVLLVAPGAAQADPSAMRLAYEAAAAAPVERQAQAAMRPWIYTDFGAPGTVVEQSEIPGLGIIQVRFANSVRLLFKQNTTARNQIMVRVKFGRGQGDIPPAPVGMAGGVNLMLNLNGPAEYSPSELSQALAGKQATVTFGTSDGEFVAAGTTRPEDLATQLQLMTARFSKPGWRPDLYGSAIEAAGKMLATMPSDPRSVYSSKTELLLHNGDSRWATPTPQELSALSAKDVRAFIEPILTTSPLVVMIAGDTTVETAIAEVGKTFGALPARAEPARAADTRRVSFPAPTATPVVVTHAGRADQAIATVAWPTAGGVRDPKDALTADILAAVMRSRLIEQFRAHDGKTYSPAVTSSASAVFDGYGMIQAQAEVAPADIDAFYAKVEEVAADLIAAPISADELARAVSPMVETYLRGRQSNTYWLNWMGRLDANPWAPEHMRTMPAGLTAITPADVQDSARKWLAPAKAWKAKAVAANVP